MDRRCPLCPSRKQWPCQSNFRISVDFILLYLIGIYELVRQWCLPLIFRFFHHQDNVDPLKDLASLSPIIIFTGGSSGIGRHILKRLKRIGCDIISLTQESDIVVPDCTTICADFNSLASTKRAAGEVLCHLNKSRRTKKVLLWHCAGVFYPQEGKKDQSDYNAVEQTLNVNFLMPSVFLQLLDAKIDGIVWMGSSSHAVAPHIVHAACPVHIATTPYAMYPLSKLLSVIYMEHWSNVSRKPALVVHPGIVATRLYKGERGLVGVVLRALLPLIAWNPAHSAERVLKLIQLLRFCERVQTVERTTKQMSYTEVYCDVVSMGPVMLPSQIRNHVDNVCIAEKLCAIVTAHAF